MVKQIYHVGITVTDLERSVAFYKKVLGYSFLGEITMKGKETELLFQRQNCVARVGYLKGSDDEELPSVELIQFMNDEVKVDRPDLFKTSISELCFYTDDIEEVYENLKKHNVECLSKPQPFDFTKEGFGKSLAFYFKDPDGNILEMMQKIL